MFTTKKISSLLAIVLIVGTAVAQDLSYSKRIVEELASDKYEGRGYVNRGDEKAAQFIASEMEALGLSTYTKNYFQPYQFPINTFPVEPTVKIDNKLLKCATEYMVYPTSPSIKGEFPIAWITKKIMTDSRALAAFLKEDHSNSFVAIDSTGLENKELYNFATGLLKNNQFGAKGVLVTKEKMIWSARKWMENYPTLVIKNGLLPTTTKTITVSIENKFIKKYKTQNVVGYLPGKSDSTIVFVAHYDHMGRQGDHIYHGALDNASGVSMVLSIAKNIIDQKQKPAHSIAFLLVSGEESGLNGSTEFVTNPIMDLSSIKQVINFDMVGSGTGGVYFFNGKENPQLMNYIISENDKNNYLKKIHNQGLTLNSDHAPFHKKGISAVGLYTGGDVSHYHRPDDLADQLTYGAFEGLIKVLTSYSLQ